MATHANTFDRPTNKKHHFATSQMQLLSLAVAEIPCRFLTRFSFPPLCAARFLRAS
jgi:hypothetical protein